MKKVIIVLAILAFAVSTAFAGVTSVTKEQSKASYPGLLGDSSMLGANVFLTDAAGFGKVALLESNGGSTWGLISNTIDFGQIIISSSPNPDGGSPVSLSISKPSSVIGLQVLPKLDDIVIGIGLLIGKEDATTENKDKEVAALAGNDYVSTSESYYGILLGAKIEGISIGLKVRMAGEGDQTKNYSNTAPYSNVTSDVKTDGSALGIDVAAKMAVSDWVVALGVGIDNGERKIVTKTDSNDDGDYADAGDVNSTATSKDSAMGINVLAGTTVGKTEKLMIDVATGIGYTSSQSTDSETKNENSGTTNYGAAATQRTTTTNINWTMNVGVEANLNETWTVNAGTVVSILRLVNTTTKVQKDADATTNDYRDLQTYSLLDIDNGLGYAIGLTGVIGALTIDMRLNPAILLMGPEFLTGNGANGSSTGNLNSQIALIYNY